MAKEPKTLRDLLVDELRDLYDAEKQLTKALPKLARAATSDDLQAAFELHFEETKTHLDRLEQVFKLLDEKARARYCAGIGGIIDEAKTRIEEDYEPATMDAGLVAGGQRVERYEIAAYGSVIAWAKTLGLEDVAALLHHTLDEEKAADEKLARLAEAGLNSEALRAAASKATPMFVLRHHSASEWDASALVTVPHSRHRSR